MNVMSLASIAFGTGEASMAKGSGEPEDLVEDAARAMAAMSTRAAERAGGVRQGS